MWVLEKKFFFEEIKELDIMVVECTIFKKKKEHLVDLKRRTTRSFIDEKEKLETKVKIK